MMTQRMEHLLRAELGGIALVLVACTHSPEDRGQLLARADAARLVGAWDMSMVLERPITRLIDSTVIARPVTGSIAFTENRTGAPEVGEFGVVTGRGVADLDLHAFSLPFGGDEPEGEVVARTEPIERSESAPGASVIRDSVTLMTQSAEGRVTVRLFGVLAADTIAGRWFAQLDRSEASGRFVMRRRTMSRE